MMPRRRWGRPLVSGGLSSSWLPRSGRNRRWPRPAGRASEMEPGKKSTRLRGLGGGALALAAEWTFYAQVIAPLRGQTLEAGRAAAAMKGRIEGARETIREVQAMEARMNLERSKLGSLHGDLPSGSALVWFPN